MEIKDKKEFAQVALDENIESFVIYMIFLSIMIIDLTIKI